MNSSENPKTPLAEAAVATQQPTAMTRMPPAGRKFPCTKCGARLDFDPSSHALQCPYCGFKEAIEPAASHVRERNWDEFWANSAGQETLLEGRKCQVTCSVCGAVVLLEDKVAADKCPYCGIFLENKPVDAQSLIAPGGLLPFKITDHQARQAFGQWLAGRWFAPNGLKEFANLGQMAGVYAPYWTYDSMTFTHYTGERGDDYFVTETYQERDANGQMVTKTRQVRKTRWTFVSGEVRHFFDDVLIYASQSLPENYVYNLAPWDLPEAEDFRSDFLSGFKTERYTIGLKDGFEKARGIMHQEIRRLCCRNIGGDHQRLNAVDTQYMGITFKHLLLPMWLAVYRYQNQPHRVLVNGRTGKVVGSRPYSWIKITLFILAIVAAVLLAVWLFNVMSKSGGTSNREVERLGVSMAVDPDARLDRKHGTRNGIRIPKQHSPSGQITQLSVRRGVKRSLDCGLRVLPGRACHRLVV